MKVFRFFSGLLILAAGILAVSLLQNRFDQGDVKKALAAVRLKFPEETKEDACRAEVVSRLRGQVRVRCRDKSWLVDLLRGVITP